MTGYDIRFERVVDATPQAAFTHWLDPEAQRRELPPGGEVPEDYRFVGEDGAEVRLAELFGNHDTLIIYSSPSTATSAATTRGPT